MQSTAEITHACCRGWYSISEKLRTDRLGAAVVVVIGASVGGCVVVFSLNPPLEQTSQHTIPRFQQFNFSDAAVIINFKGCTNLFLKKIQFQLPPDACDKYNFPSTFRCISSGIKENNLIFLSSFSPRAALVSQILDAELIFLTSSRNIFRPTILHSQAMIAMAHFN